MQTQDRRIVYIDIPKIITQFVVNAVAHARGHVINFDLSDVVKYAEDIMRIEIDGRHKFRIRETLIKLVNLGYISHVFDRLYKLTDRDELWRLAKEKRIDEIQNIIERTVLA